MPSADQLDRAAERRVTILELIAELYATRGYPPSQTEIAEHVGVSRSQVRLDLDVLRDLGRIEIDAGVTRGIRLVSDAQREERAALDPATA